MKLLIIGLGSMGKRRARLAKGMLPDAELFGVDTTESRRNEAATLGITPFASIAEAVLAQAFDAALVCTAPITHAAIIAELLDNNLPVFSELNLISDGYEENIAKAKAKGLPLFLSSTMLYRGETQYMKQQIEAFGKPVNYVYHVGQYLPDWHPWENYKNFFVGDKRTSGVRELFGIELPWLLDTFGPVVSVQAQKDKLSDLEIDYPDSYYVMLRHQNGTKGFLAADVVSPKAVRNFECFGEGLHLFWGGSPTTLCEYDAEAKEKRQIQPYQNYEQDPRYSDNVVENAYLDEMLNFFAVLEGEEEPRWSFEKDIAVIRLMDEVEQWRDRGAMI